MKIIFFSFVCSWFLLYASIPVLRRRLLDLPNARSSHLKPTPRGGGFAFVIVSFICSSLFLLTSHVFTPALLPLLAFPLAFVGLIDDIINLPASWRYGFQIFTALLILGTSPIVQSLFLSDGLGGFLQYFYLLLLLISVTAVINFTNFMDGLDGLVAGCMLVTIISLVISLSLSWPLWALVGALLGFLPWNWGPAKVFMGDVGSTFLGAVFAGLVLQSSSWSEALCHLLVATPLLADACLCVFRRFVAGDSIFQAHRLHLFQRLHQAGWSHTLVSSLYILATAALSAALLFGSFQLVVLLVVAELLIGFWLDQKVAVPFDRSSSSLS